MAIMIQTEKSYHLKKVNSYQKFANYKNVALKISYIYVVDYFSVAPPTFEIQRLEVKRPEREEGADSKTLSLSAPLPQL